MNSRFSKVSAPHILLADLVSYRIASVPLALRWVLERFSGFSFLFQGENVHALILIYPCHAMMNMPSYAESEPPILPTDVAGFFVICARPPMLASTT